MSENNVTKSTAASTNSGGQPRRQSAPLSRPHALTALAAVLNELGRAGLLVTWTNNDDAGALIFSIGGAQMDTSGAKLRIVERSDRQATAGGRRANTGLSSGYGQKIPPETATS